MKKIQKFQFGRLYCAANSKKTFELIDRDGHRLMFRVRCPKDQMTYKVLATSAYKADETGAFEEILLQDGTRVRSDAWLTEPAKFHKMETATQESIVELMAALAA